MSTTNQIGRLIDSLSKGMDAGSFNILPLQEGGNALASPIPAMPTRPFDRNGGSFGGDSLRSDLSVDAQLEQMIGKLNGMARAAEQRT